MVKLTGLEPVVVRHSEFESLIGDQEIKIDLISKIIVLYNNEKEYV